jgi:hypothetical protein
MVYTQAGMERTMKGQEVISRADGPFFVCSDHALPAAARQEGLPVLGSDLGALSRRQISHIVGGGEDDAGFSRRVNFHGGGAFLPCYGATRH